MSGVLFLALCAFLTPVSWQDPGGASDSVPTWDDLPTAKNRLVKFESGEGSAPFSVAEGLAVVALPAINAGLPLGLASGRSGEVWMLAETPQPSLPGGPAKGLNPQLIRFGWEMGGWRETGRFPVPGGSRRLAAAGREILLGAPGMVWRLSADQPDKPIPWLVQFRGGGEIPLPGIDEQGVAHVVVPHGIWSWKSAGGKDAREVDPTVFVPESAWGMVRLPLWTGGRMEVHATGLKPGSLWTTPTQDGEWFVASPGGRGSFLQVVRAGNELGFRQGHAEGISLGRMPPGMGAVQPLVVFREQKITAGAWVTSSLGPDWGGTCWVGEPGRVIALAASPQGGATRLAKDKRTVLAATGSDLFPVAMVEDAGGEGVWVLTTGRDVGTTGQLPFEAVPNTRLFLVRNPDWLSRRDVTHGPLSPDSDIRDQLMQFPEGPGRLSKARELAEAPGTKVEQLAALALDNSVSLSTRREAWAGLTGAGKADQWVGRMLGTDQPLLRASAARCCQSLARLPADAAEPMLAGVQDADGAVSRETACAAALHRVPGVAESLAAALFQRDEADPQVQSANLHALGLLGREGVERMLSAAQTGVRAEAVRALRARVGFPWPSDQGGAPELWLEHPHLGPEHLSLYLEGLRAWRGWGPGPDDSAKLALKWLENHGDQPSEVLEAGLRLSGDLPVGQASLDWWRQMVRERKGIVAALAMDNLAGLPVPAWGGEVAAELEQEELSSAERLAGLRLMQRWGQSAAALKLAVPLLEPGALPGQDPLVTTEALRVLSWADPPRVVDAALRVLQGGKKSSSLVRKAALVLARDEEVRRTIQRQFVAGLNPKIPSLGWSVWLDAMAEAGAAKDWNEAVAGNWLADDAARARMAAAVRSDGDARRGLFVALDRSRANCVGCHAMGATGGRVGPGLKPALPLGGLVKALIDPAAHMDPAHGTVRFRGRDGQQVRGVLLNPGSGPEKEWLVRDGQGQTHRIAKSENESPVADPDPLMPSAGTMGLRYQDLVDLLAFFGTENGAKEIRALEGLILEAEIRLPGQESWTRFLGGPDGAMPWPAKDVEVRVPVFLHAAGEVTMDVAGAKLAPGQSNRARMEKGPGSLVIRLADSGNGAGKKFALRLLGPQGLEIGGQ